MIRLQLRSFQFASHLSKHDTSPFHPLYNPFKEFRLIAHMDSRLVWVRVRLVL